ncbi:phosphoesterase [Rhodovibrio salinarum]|uniref:Phosphoesterase n=2 Tax=Rhodovibrio salinarum TaxID=1087 RepID=A0A934QJJ0_9PROT|nr:ligase-associated DNA damage response endonuclease PdeM [Rhodovibrio salinarum]MBK1698086.1 phosphoesterase [Rhodovibrio salinarum]
MSESVADSDAAIRLNGADLVPDVSGALWWPARSVLVVADLHLEKGSSYSRHNLPPYDSRATLERLQAVIDRRRPEHVICLGDSFHDRRAADRLADDERAQIQTLAARVNWTWIAGNHDPAPPADWGGTVAQELTLGPLVFRHAADPAHRSAGEVSGHYHPKTRVRVRGKGVSARCFVADGRRLILPAFGAYTGGLSVLDPAIANLFPRNFTAHLIGKRAVYPYPRHALVG